MENQYPNSGALFPKEKRTDRSPDFSGTFTLDGELLDYIVKNARGGSVKLSVTAWKRQGRTQQVLGLKIEKPWSPDEEKREAPRETIRTTRGEYKREEPRGRPARRETRQELDDELPPF